MSLEKLFLLPALTAALGLLPAGSVMAQTFQTIYSFSTPMGIDLTNSDGTQPTAGLTLSGNTLFGTAHFGGVKGFGTVFRINTDGSSFTNLHNFSVPNNEINSDGDNPLSNLVLVGNSLFGDTEFGGSGKIGVVFKVDTDGSGFSTVYNVPGIPPAGTVVFYSSTLTASGNFLYGVQEYGGSGSTLKYGAIFKGSTNGTGFAPIYYFTGSTGAYPVTCLVSGSYIYGLTISGGSSGSGVVFRLNTDGTGFTNLYTFTATVGLSKTNSDGAAPQSLILSGTNLYGDAEIGGIYGSGTIFRLNTNGTGFTNLYTFSAMSGPGFIQTNSDGSSPQYGLILAGHTLYGTAASGGIAGSGTVFGINTDGTGFTNLHTFTATADNSDFTAATNNDGAYPYAGVILSNNTLYGTAQAGGINGDGTIFSISLPVAGPPTLAGLRSGTNFIVTWPASFTGFTLQSTTNLASPAAWVTNTTIPIVVNTNNVVTNSLTGTQKFYRLSQ